MYLRKSMSCYASTLKQLQSLEENRNIMIIILSRVIQLILYGLVFMEDAMAVILYW